jgi:phosphoglycolate phosphatase-like HAD superfamily hydrolase
MNAISPTILALDFDGVLCDGLLEYFQVAWRAYCQLWQPANFNPPDGLADRFYRLRPVVEVGWEMPVLIHALLIGIAETEIERNWGAIAPGLVTATHFDAQTLGRTVDQLRDDWIATDPNGWLGLHRFYPGVIERLREVSASSVYPVIISTKEGRFIRQLLQQQGIELSNTQIIGKESQRPKHQVLRELISQAGDLAAIWFVEDRLKTLHSIQQQPDLDAIGLYLADWGYNTLAERAAASQDSRIHLLAIATFNQDFATW